MSVPLNNNSAKCGLMNEPEGTKSSYSSKSIFPLKIWRKGKKLVNLPAETKLFDYG